MPNHALRVDRPRAAVSMLALLALVAACAGQSGDPSAPAGTASGEPPALFEAPPEVTLQFVDTPAPVPDLVMETLDGETISLADQRGKAVLVNFWATWCGPCREEVPYLVQLAARYPDHLTVIGVSEDAGGAGVVKAFASQYGVNYPLVMSTPEIKRAFPGVFALPTSFIVDTEGQIVQTHVGLVSPVLLEQEARYLTSLPNQATVEFVEPNTQILLANAAQATEIPGVDLSVLSPAQKEEALRRLNSDGCPCGCQLTLAQCRINDAACDISPPIVERVIAEIAGAN
ncbi:MAG: TlpA family protein disulfide reductase [Acidobacteria bacterium]|nr:TlpA family protein disulfide reductase [Acidobacteriota bacterium]MYD72083.1 TlpA family protein disulfide reductase [Acidobacteriota bacterium]